MKPIKRLRPTSDASPPWADMTFTQPIESDALHELLKEQYPQCKTLRQRKHMAAIDFLRRELDSMQNEATNSRPGTPRETHALSDFDAYGPGLDEPAELKHQRSVSPALSLSNTYRSPVLLDQQNQHTVSTSKIGLGQQHVFSIVDGFAAQPKKKRKMTVAERSAYKTTRKIGACEKCKRQKGKCTHVIGNLVSMARPSQENSAVSQRFDATPSVLMTAFNAEEPVRTGQQTQRFSQQRASLCTSSTTQSITAPGSPQWAQEVQDRHGDIQPEIPGYVNSHITEPFSMAPQNSQEAQWSDKTSFVEPQTFQDAYNGYVDPLDPDDVSHSFSHFPGASPGDVQYPSGSFDSSWNQPVIYMSGEANPG